MLAERDEVIARFALIVLQNRWKAHMKLARAYYGEVASLDTYYATEEGGVRTSKGIYIVLAPRRFTSPPPEIPVKFTPTSKLRP